MDQYLKIANGEDQHVGSGWDVEVLAVPAAQGQDDVLVAWTRCGTDQCVIAEVARDGATLREVAVRTGGFPDGEACRAAMDVAYQDRLARQWDDVLASIDGRGSSPTKADVRCECGAWSGEYCAWRGSAADTVVVEFMPEHVRADHERAGNRGVYPHNGATRVRVCRACAAQMFAGDAWCALVSRADDERPLRLYGATAVRYARRYDRTLCRQENPARPWAEAREGLSSEEAERILREDPRLVYVDVES